MKPGQALFVVRTVNGHVLVDVLSKRFADAVKEFLTTLVAHGAVGKVRVHAGAVPIALDGFWMVLDVVAVTLGEAIKHVASHPEFVAGLLGALGENLEFPLAAGDFLVDTFEVQPGLKAEIGVLFNKRTAVGVLPAYRTVVEPLWAGITANGETEWQLRVNVHDEVFLLVAEPEIVVIIVDGRTTVAGVRRAVRVHDLAHHEPAVHALRVGEDVHGLQQAVGGAAIGLLGR